MIDGIPFCELPFWLMFLIAAVVMLWGLSLGSFTTCVVYRVPRKLSLWRQTNGSYRSFCPVCHAELHTRDLIPVFSWLIQKGRCRYCKAPIPPRYLWIELSVMALVVALAFWVGITVWFFLISLLIPVIAGVWSFFRVKP